MPPIRGLVRKAGRNRSTTTRSISSYTSGMLASVSRENSHTRAVGPRFTRSRTRSSVPVVGGDGSDDVAIGLQGVGQRPFGPIAQLGEARREAAVKDDKELVSQLDGRRVARLDVEILRRQFVAALPGGVHESQQRSARRVTAERVRRWRGRRLNRGRRSRARLREHCLIPAAARRASRRRVRIGGRCPTDVRSGRAPLPPCRTAAGRLQAGRFGGGHGRAAGLAAAHERASAPSPRAGCRRARSRCRQSLSARARCCPRRRAAATRPRCRTCPARRR